jgi:hypothetical protein
MQEPHELHWKVTKHIIKYVQGTISYGIHYVAGCKVDLIGFTDSDWDGDGTDRNSTSGYTLNLGSGPTCLLRKNQFAIALYFVEAEYKSSYITIYALWLWKFITELGIQFHRAIVISCDNQSTLKFCRDPL